MEIDMGMKHTSGAIGIIMKVLTLVWSTKQTCHYNTPTQSHLLKARTNLPSGSVIWSRAILRRRSEPSPIQMGDRWPERTFRCNNDQTGVESTGHMRRCWRTMWRVMKKKVTSRALRTSGLCRDYMGPLVSTVDVILSIFPPTFSI